MSIVNDFHKAVNREISMGDWGECVNDWSDEHPIVSNSAVAFICGSCGYTLYRIVKGVAFLVKKFRR